LLFCFVLFLFCFVLFCFVLFRFVLLNRNADGKFLRLNISLGCR